MITQREYLNANNFFEINMVKDYLSLNMQSITEKEVKLLTKIFSKKHLPVLDIMCGYGRIANKLSKDGYSDIDGVDIGDFDFIKEPKRFNFYNQDFFEWNSKRKYMYLYSLYNSYINPDEFTRVINSAEKHIDLNGIFVIDIFNSNWREKLPSESFKKIYDNGQCSVNLLRKYKDGYETSTYIIMNKDGQILKEYIFTQCFLSLQQVKKAIPSSWSYDIFNSQDIGTRMDDQKHVLILKRKE